MKTQEELGEELEEKILDKLYTHFSRSISAAERQIKKESKIFNKYYGALKEKYGKEVVEKAYLDAKERLDMSIRDDNPGEDLVEYL